LFSGNLVHNMLAERDETSRIDCGAVNRLRRRGSDPRSSADDAVTTLRVKSEDGSQSYIVKMHGSETIDHLRQYLDKHR